MKIFQRVLGSISIVLLLACASLPIGIAAESPPPSLVVSQFKLTSSAGQYVMLYNQTADKLNLANFEVIYINSSGKLTSIPLVGNLEAHGYYMLADDNVELCYQMIVDAVSLGFATTSGSLQIWQVSADKTTKSLQDSMTWASKATTGAVTLPAQNADNTVSLLRMPRNELGNPQVEQGGSSQWQAVQPSPQDACALQKILTAQPVPSPGDGTASELAQGPEPPATIITVNPEGDAPTITGPNIPAADIGLAAPRITELLPNPVGTGTDDSDEFIELYNPNDKPFDLSGFILQIGTTTKRKFTFAAGTNLPAKSFVAFYSSDTGLNMSNSGSQVTLLDPAGTTISQSDVYGTAKDGQVWALANGKWYWSLQMTPNAPNSIKQAATTTSKTKATTKAKVASATTKSRSTASAKSAPSGSASGSLPSSEVAKVSPIHPWTLAVVIALAVLYGCYEYRHDLANYLYQLRRHRAARRAHRS